jgi:hypothetical protein
MAPNDKDEHQYPPESQFSALSFRDPFLEVKADVADTIITSSNAANVTQVQGTYDPTSISPVPRSSMATDLKASIRSSLGFTTFPPSLSSSLAKDTGAALTFQSISTLGSEVAITSSGRDDDSVPASPTAPNPKGPSGLDNTPKADRSSDVGATIQIWRETVRQASFDGGVDVIHGGIPRTPRLSR